MKRVTTGSSDTTTVYIGKSYEKVTTGSDTIHKNFIYAGSKVIAIKESSGTNYMHADTQGNIIAISKDTGVVQDRRSYTPFGELRAMVTKEGTANALNQTNITNRGYTGHEHLEGTAGLIHMNGRVYDATIGRFMSADPLIQAPADTQSYNRYSYVRNNPVNLTDPSGYSWLSKIWKKIKPIVAIAVAAAVVYFTAGIAGAGGSAAWGSFFGTTTAGKLASAIAAGALAGGASSAIMTGTVSGTLKGALWGGIGGGLAFGIGHMVPYVKEGGGLAKHFLHGLSRGAISKAQGGTFKAGFYSGFASSAFNPGTTMGNESLGNAGGFGLRTTMAGIVGGTASELGGGKFANGAVSGAFVHMFNAEAGKFLENKDLNMRTLVKITNEIDRIYKMDQETFEKEIGFGVNYPDKKSFEYARMSVTADLAKMVQSNAIAMGLNYQLLSSYAGGNVATALFSAVDTLYTIFGNNNNYKVAYFCIPGNPCSARGIYIEK